MPLVGPQKGHEMIGKKKKKEKKERKSKIKNKFSLYGLEPTCDYPDGVFAVKTNTRSVLTWQKTCPCSSEGKKIQLMMDKIIAFH